MARPIVIDTDTASDDAVALIMALRHPDVEVRAVTTVAGNCPIEQATRNALYTAELCDADVPVHVGAAGPLEVEPAYATWFHGEDGFGDQGYPPPRREPAPTPAVEAIIAAAENEPGLTLVTLGPLTNVARALERAPHLAEVVGRCVVMGGAPNTVGNVTPAAEFNLWFDPHAARSVFASPLPIEMVGWQLCRGDAVFDEADIDRLRSIDTDVSHFMVDCNATAIEANYRQSGARGIGLPEPTAMAVALEPTNVVRRRSHHHVEIEAQSPLTRGMSVVDALDVTGNPPNTEVVWELDVAHFKNMVFQAAR